MSVTKTSRVKAQLVKADGTMVNVESVEFFSGHSMIWLRELRFEQGSIVEVVVEGRRRAVKAIENAEQVCKIRLERE